MLVNGDQKHHMEIRVRIVCEGIVNIDKYMNEEYLGRGSVNCYKNGLATQYAQYSDQYSEYAGVKVTPKVVRQIYCAELFATRVPGSFMGIWQLFQLANILNVPVQSIYHHKGWKVIRPDFNRIMHVFDEGDREPVKLMWTTIGKAPPQIGIPTILSHCLHIDIDVKEVMLWQGKIIHMKRLTIVLIYKVVPGFPND